MRILVTGTEGYLGCLLAATLMDEGHDVIGVDTGFYKNGWLYAGVDRTPVTLAKDIRTLSTSDLDGVEAIVHMAELSNDPIGDLIGDVTYDINHHGSVKLAELAKAAGVKRFIYMSSCSVYGVAAGTVDESSPTDPQTAYARCKALVERDVSAMASDEFSPTFLRNATAFGASPRMRFDIVLNNLSGLAWTENNIAMTSDGTPWRPLVHGLDIAKAIRMSLAAPRESVHGQIFNVGSDNNNYTVRDIAETVAAEFPGCAVSFGPPSADNRSYRVGFDKIKQVLPGYTCDWDAAKGAAQLHQVFKSIDMDAETFTGRGHTRLKQIEHLMKTGQVDSGSVLVEAVKYTRTAVDGAVVVDLEMRSDDRGFFARTFDEKEFAAEGLDNSTVQCNLSFNHLAGTLRGLHRQKPPHAEGKLVRCTRGAIVDVAVDVRPDSPTFGRHVMVELTADNRTALFIPPYVAHGYQTLLPESEVIYQVSGPYAPEGEQGYRYDDPSFALSWPLEVTVVSDKDRAWPLVDAAEWQST